MSENARTECLFVGRFPKTFLNCYKLVSGNMEEDMYDKVGRRRMDRLFIDTGISCQEAVDVFTWTNATLIRLLQLQKKHMKR